MKTLHKPPSVRQLQYFVTIAESGSFRRAATELEISQPALTNQIVALESALGITLFERSRNGTLLSPKGRAMLPLAHQVLLSFQGLMEQADVIAAGHEVTYKLGVPPTLGPYLLPNVLPELHNRYSHLKLYVREALPQALQDKLLKGEYDIAIVPLPLRREELAVEPLFTEPLKFVVPADHQLAGRSSISPIQLRGEKVLTLEEQHHYHHEVQEICHRFGALIQRDYEGTSLDTLRQMVVMGMGVAFLPGLYVHSEMHNPEALHVTEIRGRQVFREHGLVWRASAPGRVFYRELAASMRQIIRDRLSGIVQSVEK